jgi:hypothetical protein
MPGVCRRRGLKGNALGQWFRDNCYNRGEGIATAAFATLRFRECAFCAPRREDCRDDEAEPIMNAAVSVADPVMDYIRAAQPIYRALQHTLVQLSAFMLSRLAGRGALADCAPVEITRDMLTGCDASLAALRVPAAAMRHRHHLGAARDALDEAVRAVLSRTEAGDDALFRALEETEHHLKALARTLPGFAPVDFTQACCAAHAGFGGAPTEYPRTRRVGEDNGRLFDLGAGLRCG